MYSPSVNNVMAQKDTFSFLNIDPFPFTNANLDDPLNMPSMDDEDDYDSSPPFTKKTLSKDEKRAEHNAIERARRESLNNKFQQLAQTLPNLMNYRRPSKSQIVEKALDWVKKSISREERYRYQIIQLQKENKRLLAQLIGNHHQHPPSETIITSPKLSPSASISTPMPTTTNDGQQQQHHTTYDPHALQQRQQYYHHRNTPHPSVSATTESSTSSSSIRHHLSDFVDSPATTAASSSTAALHQPSFLYDLRAPSSWLSSHHHQLQQSTPSSLASHTYNSVDDLHQAYDKKDIDPAVFQSPPSNDFYLDTMMMPGQSNNRPSPSTGFIQPTASRSTPAFSSSRRR